MRKSKTLERLQDGKISRVACLGHYIPSFVAHAARSGYDCIWLDLEHRALEVREVQALLNLFHLHDIDCMVRPPTREKAQLYRYLEDGASGLMIPHVNTAEEARQLVSAVKFPPIGDRGLDGAGMDSNFLESSDVMAFAEAANQETFLTIQIETPQAVDNCEEIIAVEGVDLIFVGPGDLGLRYRQAGDHDGQMLEAAFEKVASACAKYGKAWGCPAGTPEAIRQRYGQGARFLANFGEYVHIMNGLNESIQHFAEYES